MFHFFLNIAEYSAIIGSGGESKVTNDFELAFGLFLESQEYDAAEAAMFSLVRAAFLAGWQAAGGETPKEKHL